MYSHWTNITERDLIQKGASYKRIRTNLKVEKIVLNMTLPNISSSIPSNKVGSLTGGTISKKNSGKKNDLDKTALKTNNDRESILNLSVMSLLAVVSGQRPVLTKARKSIANWKIRKNQVLGFKVTLRGKPALEFLDKTVRFQNINEQDLFAKNTSSTRGSSSEDPGKYSLQSLGNLSVGIKNLNFYPELEDLWIAQNLGMGKSDVDSSSGKSGVNRYLGLDLSLNFKNSNEISQIINSIKRKPGGQKLIEDYSKNIQAFPVHIKTNKHVLSLRNLILLRKLYLTSLGFFPAWLAL